MKRNKLSFFSAVLLAAALLLMPVTPVSATEALIPEYSLSLSLPSSLDVITRNMPADDPVLPLYGLTVEGAREQLISERLFLKAYDIAGEYTVSLSLSTGGGDYSLLSEAELLRLANGNAGKAEVFYTSQAAFLLYPDAGGTALYCQTEANGLAFRLALFAASAVNDSMSSVLRFIAGSADFGLGQ